MWFVRYGSQVTGPFTEEQLRAKRKLGEFSPLHQISTDRIRWESAAQLVQMLDGAPPTWRVAQPPSPPAGGPAPSTSSGANPAAPPATEWYYVDSARQQVGPVPEQTVRDLLVARRLSRNTLVCKVGETQWNAVSQHPELARFAPSGSGRMIAFAATGVLGVGVLATWLILRLPHGVADPAPPSPGKLLITSVTDEKKIKAAVGFVVCGWTVQRVDGNIEEVRVSSGSCFAVTPDGYLVTNKHVIEDVAPRMRMQADVRIKNYCQFWQSAFKKAQANNADEDSQRFLLSRTNPADYQKIDPKVWVFFGSKDEMYEAEILHVSSFDMSILKIRRKDTPYFRLCTEGELPHQGQKVYSLGFPGEAIKPHSKEEAIQRALIEENNKSRIQGQFLPDDFKHTQHSGDVSRIFESNEGHKIEHEADIKHGNSGGPLVTPDAKVIGINTWGYRGERDISGMFVSLAMPQLIKEIDRAIEQDREKPSH